MEAVKLMDIRHGWFSCEADKLIYELNVCNSENLVSLVHYIHIMYDQNGNEVEVTAVYKTKKEGKRYGWKDKIYLGLVFRTKEEANWYKDVTEKILYL